MSVDLEKVKKIISDQLNVESDEIKNESSFVDDLGADSIDTVELIMAFETEFSIDIPEDEAERLSRVEDLVKYIESKSSI